MKKQWILIGTLAMVLAIAGTVFGLNRSAGETAQGALSPQTTDTSASQSSGEPIIVNPVIRVSGEPMFPYQFVTPGEPITVNPVIRVSGEPMSPYPFLTPNEFATQTTNTGIDDTIPMYDEPPIIVNPVIKVSGEPMLPY